MTAQPTSDAAPVDALQPLDIAPKMPTGVTVTIGLKPYTVAEDGRFIPVQEGA